MLERDLILMQAAKQICCVCAGRFFILAGLGLVLLVLSGGPEAQAEFVARNELHFQYGKLKNPSFAGGGSTVHRTFTWQHSSQWNYGDSFFFVDQRNPKGGNTDIYIEGYTGLSLSKITGKKIGFGILKDIAPRVGFNWGADTNVRKLLVGGRLSWDVPYFTAVNTDFYYFSDQSKGASAGGAAEQGDTWQAHLNGALPVTIGRYKFSLEGFFEYTGARRNEFGMAVSRSLLGQPQFRLDLGDALFSTPNKLFAGVELLIWINKVGDASTDELRVQGLLAYRF